MQRNMRDADLRKKVEVHHRPDWDRALLFIGVCLISQGALAGDRPPGIAEALDRTAAISDAQTSRRVALSLWGLPLEAPVILHDPVSATSWRKDLSTGLPVPVALSNDQRPANTCVDHEGTPSVMLLLPLTESHDGLATLFWHERWHCVQRLLGLPSLEGDTAHLDGESGRTWLRLEMRALHRALSVSDDESQKQHALSALDFRRVRAGLPAPGVDALKEESKFELNEGLAEYTGRFIVAGGSAVRATSSAMDALVAAENADSFVRSAAYSTGPAYGLLLDRWSPQWRTSLSTESDLSAMLAHAINAEGNGLDAAALGADYGLEDVAKDEERRADARAKQNAEYLERFTGQGAVKLPLRTPSISFDPRTLFPLEGAGMVYMPITARDEWGELTAESGALLAKEWSQLSVDGAELAGCALTWKGVGWSLKLAEGWRLNEDLKGWRVDRGPLTPCKESD